MGERVLLGGDVLAIDLPVREDARGRLLPLEFPIRGFTPVRAFLVEGADAARRGGHAHRQARQLLMRTGGEIDVELRLSGASERVRLDTPATVLLIEPGVWSCQTYRGPGASLMVFSDRPYDPDDYLDA